MAELLLGTPLFPGDSGVDQLIEIIKVRYPCGPRLLLTSDRLDSWYTEQGRDPGDEPEPHELQVPADQAAPVEQGVPQQGARQRRRPCLAIPALRSQGSSRSFRREWLFEELPEFLTRLLCAQSLAHPFFDELREPNARLPNGKSLPNLFNFTDGGNSQFASLPDFAFASSFAEYRMMAERNLTKKLLPPEILKKAIADKKVPAPK